MAKNKGNSITSGLSGKFNGICFQDDGVMRSLPDTSNRKWSPLQVKHLTRIEQCKEYGRYAVADAKLTEYYTPLLIKWKKKIKNKRVGVYQIAICDFYHPPEIDEVKLSSEGNPSAYFISIHASDNFRVEDVSVSIFSPAGKLLDEGAAPLSKYGTTYEYCIQNPDWLNPETIARIRVSDIPGNITEKDFCFVIEKKCISLSPL
ncbi:MAG: hypothetical protein M0Q38_15815 [Bacteroidales bacterium]|jgi:hypothetical protein|nr:hypothetical protein [Bacteroidales bacterium]